MYELMLPELLIIVFLLNMIYIQRTITLIFNQVTVDINIEI